MRRLTGGIIFVLTCLMAAPAAAAFSTEVQCVQQYLSGTAYNPGPADGLIGRKTIEAARDFAVAAKLTEALPALSADTAAAWCEFAASDEATAIAELAAYRVYPIELVSASTGPVAEPDGKLPFDFSVFELATDYEGYECSFSIFRVSPEQKRTDRQGTGRFRISNGRLEIVSGRWDLGAASLSTPETFDLANLALTTNLHVVGTMPFFRMYINPGEVPVEADIVTLTENGGQLGTTLAGGVDFDVNEYVYGQFRVGVCSAPKSS